MGNRGQKRAETVDELPADKRACTSLEFRPSPSSSSVHTPEPSTNSTHDRDMEASSSASRSSRSESEADRDSAYGSCDSDEMGDTEHRRNRNALRDYQRQRSSSDQAKFKRVLSSLSDEIGESAQLAALTELCELLSFCTDSSLSSLMADSLSPILVKLATHESNPDIMLLAIRAITYLCDIHPRSSSYMVRDDGVTALCQRLMAIEYLDVAEQCLQALEKISQEQPLACLQAGAVRAVLTYIDFFSTSLQRVALATVVNICEKLPSECPSPFMEAVPILCSLLQYEDRQLVEKVSTCLIKIAERVRESPDMLDELSKGSLVEQATHLIDLNSRTSLCQPVHTGLIGLLVKLASGSMLAVRTLFELNISNILKDNLSTYDLSHGMPSPTTVQKHSNQVHEVLKLLNELLPSTVRNQEVQLALDKEAFLVSRPDLLQKFGMDLLPVLIQVVNSGVDLYVCYGCLSVINKLVYFSKSDILLELLKSTNISSFLAGVFTRKDHHVLMLTLQIVDNILQKLADVFLIPFIKEGVLFAIDAVLYPEKSSQFIFSMFNDIRLSNESSEKFAARGVRRCLCYSFDASQFPSTSESGNCRLEKDSVQNLAKHIKTNYFATESLNSKNELTGILEKLKNVSAALTDLVSKSIHDGSSTPHEEDFNCILHQIMSYLNGKDSISTFEFIESGVVKSLVNYLSNGQLLRGKSDINCATRPFYIIQKRLEAFARLFLSPSEPQLENFPLSALIWKLQSALSSVENFPVISRHSSKRKSSYATVPYGHSTSHPCFKVQFVRGEGETYLSDCSEDVLTVDPFSPFDAIESFLWPKVSTNKSIHVNSVTKAFGNNGSWSHPPEDSSPHQYKSPDPIECDVVPPDVHGVQEEKPNCSQSVSAEATYIGQTTGETTSLSEVHADPVDQGQCTSSQEEIRMSSKNPGSCSNEDASPKLLFFLEGKQLNPALTLYQVILQQQSKGEDGMIDYATLWSQVHRITYRRAAKPNGSNSQLSDSLACCSSPLEEASSYDQFIPHFSFMFDSELASAVEKFSPMYDILSLLRILEGMNRFRFHLFSRERTYAFAEGKIEKLDVVELPVSYVLQNEFVNSRLTEKLEQQMRDPLAVSVGSMPSWCVQLMDSCPFLFSFEARCKYFRLAALGKQQVQPHLSSHSNSGSANGWHPNNVTSPRKRFLVYRDRILESAAKMMDLHCRQKVLLEVEYDEEVGTGLGPTLEFYTLVSFEFQKPGLGMWREDHMTVASMESIETQGSGMLFSPFGLFPRPWSPTLSVLSGIEFSEVTAKFVLLGQIVAKAFQDGRVLDLPLSKAFYKLIIGQDLTIYDIHSFDPALGRALIEFEAVVQKRKHLESVDGEESTFQPCFQNTRFEDLYLDFSLPGYPDYVLTSGGGIEMVNAMNLEAYVAQVVDATINSGMSRQMDAFKSGFNQVFPISHLQIFTEEELECLLCGEREIWHSNELSDHIKFDHGYTASSPPILNLLEIIQEFNLEQKKAFLRFVTGASRLPPGGLASLNPKLTIVRKHCGKWVDADLPSVMTCANYLKLPPYSSKDTMKEKLLYAITEGQGSFHLS